MNGYGSHGNISFCGLEEYFLVSLSTKGPHPYHNYFLSAGSAGSISRCVTKQNGLGHKAVRVLQGHIRIAKPRWARTGGEKRTGADIRGPVTKPQTEEGEG